MSKTYFTWMETLRNDHADEITKLLKPKGYTLIVDEREEGTGVTWIRKQEAENLCFHIRGYNPTTQRFAVRWTREYMDNAIPICVTGEPHPQYILEGTEFMAWSVYQLIDEIGRLPAYPTNSSTKS